VKASILVGDWLVTGRKVDNAEPCMSECDLTFRRLPHSIVVRTSMAKDIKSALDRSFRSLFILVKYGYDSAHMITCSRDENGIQNDSAQYSDRSDMP
jgi:hypothetical protein